MTRLDETLSGDYGAYTEASMMPGNSHFVFMTAVPRAKTVQSFLESHADKGVVFVSSESHVDVEFWIAAPRKMVDALHNCLRKWAYDAGHDIPAIEQPRRGIFHAIMGMPQHAM